MLDKLLLKSIALIGCPVTHSSTVPLIGCLNPMCVVLYKKIVLNVENFTFCVMCRTLRTFCEKSSNYSLIFW